MCGYYDDFLIQIGFREATELDRYSRRGKTFRMNNATGDFVYWYYEMDRFVWNIHDFIIHEDFSVELSRELNTRDNVNISLIKRATAEMLDPYQHLEGNMVMTHIPDGQSTRCILHAGTEYFSVGVEYKPSFILETGPKLLGVTRADLKAALQMMNGARFFPAMEHIADEVINCRDLSPAGVLFYEMKALEILSLSLRHYYHLQQQRPTPAEDRHAVETVARYIDDHYIRPPNLDQLAGIAYMSKSKLKYCFKRCYDMTVTEYIQRRRMNVAEHLLISTDLNVADVARSVGYQSPSRFSQLYRKYKGILPTDFRRQAAAYKRGEHPR
ncbi:MAG: AraC family transcriptional regulator [Eubacteriales bacterium]|nr:AraC family transcriptional regulator [Eubacteriales bacterium]